MARAWPFEDRPEERPSSARTPQEFVDRFDGIDAVVVRIGINGAQLVLVDEDGRWEKWVYPSVEACGQVVESLGLEPHVGEFPEPVRVRMNAYPRPAEDFDRGAYPEQGSIGPAIPYPENRPRKVEAARKESSAGG